MFGTVHEHTDSDKGTPLVSSMALSRDDSESVFRTARTFNEAGVGQEAIPMEVNGKRDLTCTEFENVHTTLTETVMRLIYICNIM